MLIKQTLIKFCITKGIEASSERIDLQVECLKSSGHSDEVIAGAINRLLLKTPFFPDVSMVLKEIEPDNPKGLEYDAQQIVDKILEANTRFGPALDAKEFMGPEAWDVVIRFGGWGTITNLTYSDLGTARAQLRRIAESKQYTESKSAPAIEQKSELKRVDFTQLGLKG